MEEILASIRRIISEDGDDDQMPLDTAPKAAKQEERQEEALAPLPVEEDPVPSPLAIEEDEPPPPPPAAVEDDVLELTEIVEEPADETPEIEDMSGLDPEPDLGGLPPLGDEDDDTLGGDASDEEDSIISSATAAAAGAALSRLTEEPKDEAEPPGRTLPIGNGAKTLEDMVRELLRPMLREWLDQHLPDIVEEIVSREVEKIGRGRGSGRR